MSVIGAMAIAALLLYYADEDKGLPRMISYWIVRIMLFGFLLHVLYGLAAGDVGLLATLAILCGVLLSWTIATRVFVPLGMWRTAFAFGWLSRVAWEGTSGAGVVAGAWALARSGRAKPGAIAFLQRRRDAAKKVSAAHVVASALLLSARGDRDGARELFASVELLGPAIPSLPRKLAAEWICADAAERGDWNEAARVGRASHGRSRASLLIGAAAARLAGLEDAPGKGELWLLWLVAPHRRHTRGLLRAALAANPGESSQTEPRTKVEPEIEMAAAGERPDTLASALDLHIRTTGSRPTTSSLHALGRAWDRAIEDPNTRDGTLHRAAVLGAPSGPRALAELELEIRGELAALVRGSQICLADLPDDSPMLSAAVQQVRDEILGELEVAFDALGRRVGAKRPLEGIAEWREFTSLRAAYLRAAELGGMSLRQLAFPDAHHRICALAVWLWNERKQYVISQGMFLWLLDEAIAVGDHEAIELQRKNTETAS